LAARSRDAALALVSKSLFWMSGCSLVLSLALLVFARPLAILLFGAAAAGSVPVMRWIAALPFLIAISNVLGVQTMLTFGLDRQFSRILIGSGLLNVAVGIPLIRLFGAQGAGMALLLTETAVMTIMGIVLQNHNIRLFSPRSVAA